MIKQFFFYIVFLKETKIHIAIILSFLFCYPIVLKLWDLMANYLCSLAMNNESHY